MRLEPVYLLGDPTPPAKDSARITRRRWLSTALAAGFGGFVLGVGISYRGVSDPVVPSDAEPPNEDALLQWALSLQDGATSALLDSADVFVVVHSRSRDSRLDRGLVRLAEQTRSDASLTPKRRRALAELILGHVDGLAASSSSALALDPVFESLRTLR